MPIHRIPRAHAHEDLLDIQRQGELIATVLTDGDDFIVFTNFPGSDGIERRLAPLTHAVRVGA